MGTWSPQVTDIGDNQRSTCDFYFSHSGRTRAAPAILPLTNRPAIGRSAVSRWCAEGRVLLIPRNPGRETGK